MIDVRRILEPGLVLQELRMASDWGPQGFALKDHKRLHRMDFRYMTLLRCHTDIRILQQVVLEFHVALAKQFALFDGQFIWFKVRKGYLIFFYVLIV